jgi:co-chaperonin GroES (HSP10)
MADLDDFFAQKDRAKKSKGKKSGIIIPVLQTAEDDPPRETTSVKQETKKSKDPILNVKIGDEVCCPKIV